MRHEAGDRLMAELADLAPDGWSEVQIDGATVAELWRPAGETGAADRLQAELSTRGIRADVVSTPQDDEWRDALRRHHQPIEVGGRLRVRPPWAQPRPGFDDIVIDPGMAFGTGQHATTKGCLELLMIAPAGSLLDVGCGSGVLAIAARRLGYDPVWAVDFDQLAVDATIDNAKVNGVSLRVGLRHADRDRLPAAGSVVANITGVHVVALADALPEPAPWQAILSGFRPAEADRVVAEWAARGYRQSERLDAQDWTALRLVRA